MRTPLVFPATTLGLYTNEQKKRWKQKQRLRVKAARRRMRQEHQRIHQSKGKLP